MKKLSATLSILVLLFVCGAGQCANAHEGPKQAQQDCALPESLNKEPVYASDVPSEPVVTNAAIEEDGLSQGNDCDCAVVMIKDCKELYIWVAVCANDCEDALKEAEEVADKLQCPEDIPKYT